VYKFSKPGRFAPGDMPPLENFKERLRSFKDFRSFQRPHKERVILMGEPADWGMYNLYYVNFNGISMKI